MFGNLSIRSKLVGPLAVVAAGAALLAAVEAAGTLDDRARAERERRLAAAAGLAAALVHELQEERVRAAAWMAAGDRRDQGQLAARRRRVDQAAAAYRAGVDALARTGPAGRPGPGEASGGAPGADGTGDPALDRAVAAAEGRLDRLAVIRAETDRRLVTPARSLADHDATVAALLGIERELAARLETPPAGTTHLLLAAATAKEATARERNLLVATTAGGRPGPAVTGALAAAAAAAGHALDGVRAAAGDRLGEVERALAGTPGALEVLRLELGLLDPAPVAPDGGRGAVAGGPSAAALGRWRAGLTARAGTLRRVERAAAEALAAATGAERRRQETRLRTWLVVLAVAVAVAGAARLLGRTPAGRSGAAEAPALGTVVGLARRGRTLLDRQLQLIDELERDEPDPDRRQGLGRLHHLAARLRRNTQTQLAMTDPTPAGLRHRPPSVGGRASRSLALGGGVDRPLPVAGVLQAAVAEAGEGRRVDLLATDEVAVGGAAAGDLVPLLAELVDNAIAFSPPTAVVSVTGAGDGDGYRIEITDRGLGMTGEELAWANQRLAGRRPDGPDLAAGDRLGLVIVGHLADRHGIAVRLDGSPTGGVTATVRLPAALLLSPLAPAPARRT